MGLFLITSANAQLQTFLGDTAATSAATRIIIGANTAGRGGQKGNTGNFKPYAFLSEVVAATNGAITSLNGFSGPTVTLTSANVAEVTNLYYTQTRARSAISATGPINYNSTTGVLTFSGTKSDVGLANADNTSDAAKPLSTAATTALAGKEATINAGTLAQYFRGDKTFQTLNSSAVGLGSVDNTSDANKPVSTAQATAIALKENAINAGTTAQYFRGDKTFQTLNSSAVGLGSVDNTSDANKPVSIATNTALNLKANLASTVFTVPVASYAALTSLTVPTGSTYLVQVASDTSQSAPYNVNQWYLKDSNGLTFKLALINQ